MYTCVQECDLEYRNGHESVELKVPVLEDQDHATLPISGELEVKV